ncbi:MAG: T9SS type A sorting domain-containing protein [Ignavibacteria bacterium]|nr:T9SS type A sorting domain-containing protein [Ignavibacteria bacterium]MBK6418943.1 T9SS type A sorting domain-containing protein [Ignavibacteria bacterium]MBK6760368.1 T9SS type A sorting domain-containing protein [Ignavibacteria bacterium]MBK7576181.1 T9SS type A sorting domain-containing protein [Ignavibacteria bacterium]
MIRSAFVALVALLIVIGPGVHHAQDRDSTLLFGFGTLVEVTNTTIVFNDMLSSNSEPRTVLRNEQTLAMGCTFEEVRPGTNLHVDLYDTPAGLTARFVHFEGCAPMVGIEGAIQSMNGDTLVIDVVASQPVGISNVVLAGSETQFTDCAGRIVTRSALSVGDQVKIGGYDNGSIIEATYVVLADNCPEYKTETVVLVAKRADGIAVTLENGENVDLEFGFGRPFEGDSLLHFIFSCDGRLLSWSEIEIGSTLRINYLDYPNAPDVLQDAMLEDGCPKGFSGVVASVSPSTLDITEKDGTTVSYVIDAASQVFSCSNRELTWADVLPGASVQGAWIEDGPVKKLLHVQLVDGCSYSNGATGVVIEKAENTVTVRTVEDSLLVLTIDDRSLVIDCFGMVDRPAQISLGDTVAIFFSQDRGVLYLDFAQILNSCERSKISGVIVSANATTIAVNTGNEVTVLMVDAESQLLDCSGMPVTSTPAIEGATITAHTQDGPDGLTIRTAWVDVNCAVTGIISGQIVSYQDSMLVISSDGTEQSVFVSDVTIIMDPNGVLASRVDLLVGRTVCAIVQQMDVTSMALQIILDTDCSGRGVAKGVQVQGAVESVNNGQIVVSVRGQNMMFATTGMTIVQHQLNGTASMADVASGNSIMVSSERRLANGVPVAENIVILDGTSSVDNDVVTGQGITASPNPASDVLRIDGHADRSVDVITIRDMQGRVVLLQRGTRSVSLRDVPVGAYLVSVVFTDARVETVPLTVIR